MTNGVVGCRLKNGSLDSMVLETHKSLQPNNAVARANPQRRWANRLIQSSRVMHTVTCAVIRQSQLECLSIKGRVFARLCVSSVIGVSQLDA